MKRERIAIPMLSIRPNKLSLYFEYAQLGTQSQCSWKRDTTSWNIPKSEDEISKKAATRLRNALSWMLYVSKSKKVYNKHLKSFFRFRINFITLTLSSKQIHSDTIIKKTCLHPFLDILRKKFRVNNYIWRAEKQKNGNIHFHIICDKYIPYEDVRKIWNVAQERLFYITNFRKNNLDLYKEAGISFSKLKIQAESHFTSKSADVEKLLKNYNPNSTDIHSVTKVKNVFKYVCKYMVKQGNYGKIEGDIWGLSRSLSQMKSAVTEIGGKIEAEIDHLYNSFHEKFVQYKFVSCLYINVSTLIKEKCYELTKLLGKYSLQFEQ